MSKSEYKRLTALGQSPEEIAEKIRKEAYSSGLRDGENRMREKCIEAATIPIAHTYGSENADIYHAQDELSASIVKKIKALPLLRRREERLSG